MPDPNSQPHDPHDESGSAPQGASGGSNAPAGGNGSDAGQIEWLLGDGPDADVVVSSRVRLARNLHDQRFVNAADPEERRAIMQRCKLRIMDADPKRSILPRIVWIDVHSLDPLGRDLLVERHLISQHLSRGSPIATDAGALEIPVAGADRAAVHPRAVAVAHPGERVSIMVNSLGATPPEELYILYRIVKARLEGSGATIVMPLVGRYATSMEMAGVSFTLCKLDDELEALLKAPCDCAFWRVG